MDQQMNEWSRVLHARRWMKQTESFLPLWHGYIGYKYGLFDALQGGASFAEMTLRLKQPLTKLALERWLEVGVAVRHLKKKKWRYFPTRSLKYQLSLKDERSIGFMLQEMMELHIPALIAYPDFLESGKQKTFDGATHGKVVAQTSTLVETVAFPVVQQLLRQADVKTMLDIGCGHGGYLRKLHSLEPDWKLTGLDLEQEVIEEAREQDETGEIRYEVADFMKWDHNERFDVVMMNNMLYYFSPEQRIGLLERMLSNLDTAGIAVLVTPLAESPLGASFASAFNAFMTLHDNLHPLPTIRQLRRQLEQVGFDKVRFIPFIPEGSWYIVIAEREN
ncbi:methyltransferase domain protein [Exiguobacterium sp. S17]|nr:methyltransferase domain protein [Exiguobacterium sp. S17]